MGAGRLPRGKQGEFDFGGGRSSGDASAVIKVLEPRSVFIRLSFDMAEEHITERKTGEELLRERARLLDLLPCDASKSAAFHRFCALTLLTTL